MKTLNPSATWLLNIEVPEDAIPGQGLKEKRTAASLYPAFQGLLNRTEYLRNNVDGSKINSGTIPFARLPLAGSVSVGAVKIGANITLDAGTGTISVTATNVTSALGFTPANKAGDTFTGKVNTAASAAGGAGFNVPHGVAPSAPVNGDVWTTTTGLFARISGANQQMLHSVGLSLPSIFSVSTGTVNAGSGTLTASLANQNANLVFAGPGSGAAGAPAFRALVVGDLPVVDIAHGGTGSNSKTTAFDNLSPLSGLGDLLYHNGADNVRLPGNTTATRKFLRQLGTGSASAAPDWDTLTSSDLPAATASNRGGVSVGANITLSGDQVSLTGPNVTSALGYTPENIANKGAANGYASLGADGKIPSSQIPPIALTKVQAVTDATARKALTDVQEGDVVKETSTGKTFMLGSGSPTLDASWIPLENDNSVVTVNGKTGPSVTLTTSDVAEGTSQYFTNARADARVQAAKATVAPKAHGVASIGTSGKWATEDHVHPMPSAADVGAAPASHDHASISGNAATATKLATARTISLTGDVTGSVTFDGSANASITATVQDDSHNHVISNVDGLQAALDGKAAASHSHSIANVTGLQTALDGKAPASHTHPYPTPADIGAEPALPAGAIQMYAGSAAPSGWLLCQGQTVSRTTYATLFAAIGTTYNTGGEAGTDFRLPDLRGRTPVGSGQGATLTNRALGSKGGAETHTLTISEIPRHSHWYNNPVLQYRGTGGRSNINTGGVADYSDYNNDHTVSWQGGDQGHNNMQPFLTVNFIIKT